MPPLAQDTAAKRPPTLWEQTGGLSGLFFSALPPTTFAIVNSFAGLAAGIWCALGIAVAFLVLRIARGQPLNPAIGGFAGIAIASFIAYRTGSAKGYFVVDIWWALAGAGALVVSIVVRRPLVGVLWSVANRAPLTWRRDRSSVRGYDLATAAAAAVFGARFLVQNWLYGEDLTGWLAFAKIAMGYPLTVVAVVAAAGAVRHAERRRSHLRDPARSPSRTGSRMDVP
ncbi:DUF3159 domain-containing protein [Amycolatopsis minnesotensis]|uniref:DUF3159 domain-containing protein n=1 Tax=Amycolatopsis minnesotensis TaxID=337894 RepID=A0ABN2QK24_9PSEU